MREGLKKTLTLHSVTLHREREREGGRMGESKAGGGESVKSVRFACFEISLALSLSLTRSGHVRLPRHVPLQKAPERERERGEGRGWRRKE